MSNELNRKISVSLVFFWMLISILKLIFFKTDTTRLGLQVFTVDLLFWGLSLLIILNYTIIVSTIIPKKVFAILTFLFGASIVFNYKIATMVYLLVLWFSIAKLISRKDFEKIYLAAYMFCFVYIIFYIALNGQNYFYDNRYGYIPSFGFLNPNSFAQFITIFYIFIARKFLHSILLSIFLYICFKDVIFSRTFYFILMLQPLLFLTLKFIPKKAFTLIPVFVFILSLILVFSLTSEYGALVDSIFSGRGYYSSLLLAELDSGSKIIFGVIDNVDDIPVDISFVSVLYNYGLCVVLIILYLYSKGLNVIYAEKETGLNVIIISFFAYCLVENTLVSYFLNFTLYYIFSVLFVGLGNNNFRNND